MPPVGRYEPGRKFIWGDVNPCSGCDRDMSHSPAGAQVRYHAKGMCRACYEKMGTGSGRKYVHFDESGQTCTKCSTYLSYEHFTTKSTKTRSGYSPWCRTCQKMYKFGLTKTDYDEMLSKQDFKYAICPTTHMEANRPLYVDHDHDCCPGQSCCGKCIRGLLCDECNKALGHFKDSSESLLAALRYLGR